MRHRLTAMALFTLAMPCAASGQGMPVPVATDGPLQPVTANRTIATPAGRIGYRASWFEEVLHDGAGIPQATISATAYVRNDARGGRNRPVIVAFNGGPGASSSPLHMSALGPRRLGERDAAGNRALIDNGETMLDAADLLFVDPVGTGFSRQLREGGGRPYWSAEGDAAAVVALVQGWLAREGRTGSPLYVVGESYGGYRIGMMAKALESMNVAGLVLVSPALDFGGARDQNAIDQLPTMAVAAWQHRRPAGDTRTVAQVWEEARAFAQGDYAVALQQGSALPPRTRDTIAARVAALIGLPASDVAAANLRVDSQYFLETLVPGHTVGRLDVRVAAPTPIRPVNADRPAAANDPSLGLGRSNVIVSQPIGDYLRREIGVRTTRDYASLTLDVNFAWNWQRREMRPGQDWSVVDRLATLLKARPATRLLVIGGYYDLAVPILGVRYKLSHGDIPPDRLTIAALSTGHSPFDSDLANASAMLHRFVGGESAGPEPMTH